MQVRKPTCSGVPHEGTVRHEAELLCRVCSSSTGPAFLPAGKAGLPILHQMSHTLSLTSQQASLLCTSSN